jgi:hypothetical protein
MAARANLSRVSDACGHSIPRFRFECPVCPESNEELEVRALAESASLERGIDLRIGYANARRDWDAVLTRTLRSDER